jgi:hypothetical protein
MIPSLFSSSSSLFVCLQTKCRTDIIKRFRHQRKKLQRLKLHFVYDGNTACLFNIRLNLTPLGQARQFIETCGT